MCDKHIHNCAVMLTVGRESREWTGYVQLHFCEVAPCVGNPRWSSQCAPTVVGQGPEGGCRAKFQDEVFHVRT